MDIIPSIILIKIFSYIDDFSKHLLSKDLRIISILSMSARECRKRIKYNMFNINFIVSLSNNPRAYKRSLKFNESKVKWKLHVSSFEILFKRHLKLSKSCYTILKDILDKCIIPDKIYDKLLEISVLYNRKDMVNILLINKKISKVEYSFIIAYDHKFFDIVELLFDHEFRNNERIFDFFNEEQRKEFKRIFIMHDFEDLNFKIFEEDQYRFLNYYSHSLGNKNIINKVNKETNFKPDDLFLIGGHIINKSNNVDKELKILWKNRKIRSTVSYERNYFKCSDEAFLIYRIFQNGEINLFNYLLKSSVDIKSHLYYLIYDLVFEDYDKKNYCKLMKDKRLNDYFVFHPLEKQAYLEMTNSFVLKKDITDRIHDLSKYFDPFIEELEQIKTINRKFAAEMIDYINSLKLKLE